MNKRKLQIDHLDRKLNGFEAASTIPTPTSGWIKAIRLSLGMSLQQLADKLTITKQSVQEIETREKEGSITLKSLKETASALDMELVYALVPKDGTLDDLIDRKAKELAIRIVSRTSNTMKLEDQENSKKRLKKAIEERTAINYLGASPRGITRKYLLNFDLEGRGIKPSGGIKNEMPKTLWG